MDIISEETQMEHATFAIINRVNVNGVLALQAEVNVIHSPQQARFQKE